MHRRKFLSALGAGPVALAQRDPLPNILLILADDLGYGDLGCYNAQSKIPTPRLDALAAAGIRFTDAHTPSSVCTPTRYGLLTGRYAWRTRLKNGVLDGFDPPLIENGRMTAASFLKSRGYDTACIGKWHLGMTWTRKDATPVPARDTTTGFRPGYDVDFTKPVSGGPLDAGFDSYFGISASLDMPPYCFLENRSPVTLPAGRSAEDRSLLMNQPPGALAPDFRLEDVLPACRDRAVKFLESRKGRSKPFFLYLPLTAPHLPIVPNKPFAGKSRAGAYGDFVAEVDAVVGDALDALARSGHAGNTIVLFTSDNGGLWHWWEYREADDRAHAKPTPRSLLEKELGHQSNAHLRGTKADIHEGGHRVPFIVRWPRAVPAGRVSESLVCLTDFLATVSEIAGSPLPAGAAEDSVSFLPVLRNPREAGARKEVVHHSVRGAFSLRSGPWKFIPTRGSGGFTAPAFLPPAEGEPVGQLYNLAKDPSETKNLYADHPEIVKRFAERLREIQTASGKA